ncbi:ketosteroid isomerase-like protein [Granulicella aggregans]|uniref:Ketosteroid isomerase-like protein n=1 Tax=Granulicella aggregans TaxID=474949 RepID=A0A7W7Z8S0_9BACT|nr:nuclear transport factor 2 family protein [Granulicella aggregans]MBB5055419.1 ketosteroid isomerase-like protein [Granulicella aggregans]
MKHFIRTLLFALTIPAGVVSIAQSPSTTEGNKTVSAGTTSDTVDVQHVIDAYHEAVLAHDGPRLASLFIPQGGMWLNVLSDDAFARVKAKSPDAAKIRVGSYTDFAKMVSNSKASFNPTHTNLQLNSDGTIASVYFDYVFLIDGKEQNRGSETWVLVKGPDGWRIAAVTYSSNPHIS